MRGNKESRASYVLLFLLISIQTTTYILTATKSGENSTASTTVIVDTSAVPIPSIQFLKDSIAKTLTVATADPSDILWEHIEITGSCDTSQLGRYVTTDEEILDCSGTIMLRHIPTNTLIGTWTFD